MRLQCSDLKFADAQIFISSQEPSSESLDPDFDGFTGLKLKVPAGLSTEFANGQGSIHHDRVLGLLEDRASFDVEFVADLSDDFFKDISKEKNLDDENNPLPASLTPKDLAHLRNSLTVNGRALPLNAARFFAAYLIHGLTAQTR